jgi:hypothetical protein
VIGEEPAFHAVHAQIEVIAARRGGDGVGTRLLFAVVIRGYCGQELTRGERKTLKLIDRKIEMEALG